MITTSKTGEQFEKLPNLGTATFIQTLPPEYQAFQVFWNASYWLAKFYHQRDSPLLLNPGDRLTVLGMDGITLLIVPETENA